ncbi:hypothetical protein ACFOOM_09850 [Streptomyces echinoruber]|uniref:Tyr recombinase domain-containing protein n=1 Tax=Streptomyces echinoruber TaxID=68898 RepID=A0A918RKG2_9ACTN|nr:hypothetical protein [Streptomyces echinoruber]GHA02459.1 hypothetical protein GCM10010389_47370 [Streptomyces echinoruber]
MTTEATSTPYALAGVRKVRFRDPRHTCASLLHEQGADARMIMEALGRGSIRVTMDIYTFVRLDSQRSAFDHVGDALRGDGDAAGVPVLLIGPSSARRGGCRQTLPSRHRPGALWITPQGP